MFALVRPSPLSLVAGPWANIPSTIEIDGVRVHAAGVGWTDGARLVVDVVYANQPPTEHHTVSGTSYSLAGAVLTVTRTFSAPTLAQVKTILKNRLDAEATSRWVSCRGTKNIEAAYASGVTAIDGAANIAAAINAYQGVVWP